MSKKFQRTIENFVCDNCGNRVTGNGYTDHCPFCLWGKHVDVNPGDRAAECGGSMEPLGVEERSGVYRIRYQCRKCEHSFVVKTAGNDDSEAIIKLSACSKNQ